MGELKDALKEAQPPFAPAPPAFQLNELKDAIKEALGGVRSELQHLTEGIAQLRVECSHLREENRRLRHATEDGNKLATRFHRK